MRRLEVGMVMEPSAGYTARLAADIEAMGYAEIEEDYANKPMLNLGVQFGDMYSPDINENE